MNRSDWLALSGIIFTLFGLVYLSGISDSYFLKGSPNFEISINFNNETNPQIETLNINNTGNIQAKNVKVDLDSHDTLYVKNNWCHEGTIMNLDTSNPEIIFDRMSQNINCKIEFTSENVGYIYLVTASADQSPGKQMSFDRTIPEIIKKQNLSWEQILLLTEVSFGALLVIGSFSISTIIYRILRKKQFRDKWMIERIELQKSLNRIKEEVTEVENELKNEPISETEIEKFLNLDLQVRDSSNELGRIEGKLASDIDMRKYVGEFFTKWGILEQRIIDFGEVKGIKVFKFTNVNKTVKELAKKKRVSRKFIQMFEPIRVYRNELAHGRIQATKKELLEKTKEIAEISKILDELESN